MLTRLPDILRRIPAWCRGLLALGAGAISALAMPPLSLWPILALTLPTLILLLDAAMDGRSPKARLWPAFATGWLFGMGYLLAGLWWIGQAFLVQADAFAWLMPFAVLILPAGLAIYTGLGCALASVFWSQSRSRILLLAVALTAAEWARGTLLTGFPWNNYGYALAADNNFAQSAAFFGLYGLCLVTLATLASPVALIGPGSRMARFGPLALAALVLAGLCGAGAWRLATTTVGTVPDVRLRIMQPDLPQDQKFRYDARRSVLDLYVSTSERDGGLDGVTHLIWPESAFPFFIEREAEALLRLRQMLPPQTLLVTGGARIEPAPGQPRPDAYNSLFVIDAEGRFRATADKVHLVPFGEYLPFQETLESLGFEQLTRQRGGFSAAPQRQMMHIPGLPPVVPLICYEAIFPGAIMPRTADRPGVLLNVSNDAWFGMTPGPYQHFEQARLRAVEEGLPLIRATNNGISAVIDPLGRIVKYLPLGARGILDSALPEAGSATIYARIGNSIPLSLLVVSTIIAFMLRHRYTRAD